MSKRHVQFFAMMLHALKKKKRSSITGQTKRQNQAQRFFTIFEKKKTFFNIHVSILQKFIHNLTTKMTGHICQTMVSWMRLNSSELSLMT